MKNLFLLFTVFSLLSACSKNNPEEPLAQPPIPMDTLTHVTEFGNTAFLRNAVPWNGDFFVGFHHNDNTRFAISGTLYKSGITHSFSITDIPCAVGIHALEPSNGANGANGIPQASYSLVLSDALVKSYKLDTSRTDQYVDVLRYNPAKRVIEGSFQVYFISPGNSDYLPETLAMTNGKFYVQLQ